MKQTAVPIVLFLLLSTSAVVGFRLVPAVAGEASNPILSMPTEHVNYTITRVNGTLWAVIDGDYPITIQNQSASTFSGNLPMVYPMPPQTINIHVYIEDKELPWINYTEAYPFEVHHTAIGDWWMIYSLLENVSDHFTLNIHYEHPLEAVNGSYLFLYDLNISPYLSDRNSNSTAYFTVHMGRNDYNIEAYTTQTDTQWTPINFTETSEGSGSVMGIEIYSEYGKPLLGDLVVVFSEADSSHWLTWAFPVLVGVALIVLVLYIKRQTLLSIGSKLSRRQA